MTRYVWLNINTGKFSRSWSEEDHRKFVASKIFDKAVENSAENGWKLIKYECVNQPEFEFMEHMKLR